MLAVVLGAAYVVLRQRQVWGDGFLLLRLLTDEGRAWWQGWMHPGYVPVASLARRLGPFGLPFDDLTLASSLPAAVAAAASFLFARAMGAGRAASVLAALLLAVAPGTAHVATLIEVHALHAAAVACGLCVSTLAASRGSWTLFTRVHGLAFLPVAVTHLTGPTLVPGWIAIGWWLARRHHPTRIGGAATRRFVAVQLAAAGAACVLAAAWSHLSFRGPDQHRGLDTIFANVLTAGQRIDLRYLLDDWFLPLLWVWLPLAAVLLWAPFASSRTVRSTAGLGAAWLALPVVAFTAWGVTNYGGYLAGSQALFTLLVASFAGLGERRWLRTTLSGLLVVLLPLQAHAGYREVTEYRAVHEAFRRAERIAALEQALPNGGVVVGLDVLHQPASIELPLITDVDVWRGVLPAFESGAPVDRWLAIVDHWLDVEVLAQPGPHVLDRSYRFYAPARGGLAEFVRTFERAVEARFEVEPFDVDGWPLARLEPVAGE